jgi:hypothetical protein
VNHSPTLGSGPEPIHSSYCTSDDKSERKQREGEEVLSNLETMRDLSCLVRAEQIKAKCKSKTKKYPGQDMSNYGIETTQHLLEKGCSVVCELSDSRVHMSIQPIIAWGISTLRQSTRIAVPDHLRRCTLKVMTISIGTT